MAYATLEVLAGRVIADLENHHQGRTSACAGQLRHVLDLLVTAQAPEPLAELAASGLVRGLRTHLAALARYLRGTSRLPEAVCARYVYKMSEARALRRYRVSRRTWAFFHDLAWDLDWDPVLQAPLIPYGNFEWHDELEEASVLVEAAVSTQALEDMLISSLEAYLSPKAHRRKGYEVYGIVLGMTRDVHARRRGDGISITRYVSVMRSHPQLSAEAFMTSVQPSELSLEAILAANAALYPQYHAVGDFHSHPYDDMDRLVRRKGWLYSHSDDAANRGFAPEMAELGHPVSVAFVVAIARSGKKVPKSHYRGMTNTIQMSLGGCRIILGAYRSLGSGRLTDVNIRLRLAGVTNL